MVRHLSEHSGDRYWYDDYLHFFHERETEANAAAQSISTNLIGANPLLPSKLNVFYLGKP